MVISVLPINAGNLRKQEKNNLSSEISTIKKTSLTKKLSNRQVI